jgi:hypothetical protein
MTLVHGRAFLRAAGPAVLFTVLGLAVAWNSLNYYWNWDDLHLVRVYSSQDLLHTLTGNWDPDGIENSGLRPLTTLSYHLRASAFGEQVVFHRLFLIALFAIYLASLGRVAVRMGGSRSVAILAGTIILAAKQSYYHFTWMTDGVHVLQGLFFVGAAHALLRWTETGSRWHYTRALMFAALALTTREDSLAMFPALVLISSYMADKGGRFQVTTGVLRFTAGLSAVAVAFWMWRWAALPGAAQFRFDALALAHVGDMMMATVWLSGIEGQDTARHVFLAIGGLAVLATVFGLDGAERRRALLWLIAAIAASSIGSVEIRPNLLLFPISFYALFLASVAIPNARQRGWMRVPVALLMIWIVVTSAHASQMAQLTMHPLSADQIYRDWEFTYGPMRKATIPAQRRAELTSKLARLGIATPNFDFDQWEATVPSFTDSAPNAATVFRPERHFMQF